MTATQPSNRAARVSAAAALYFAIVFAVGFVLGPIRVLWLEPWVGEALAVLVEAPFLIGAMWIAGDFTPRWAGVEGGWPSYLMIGLMALVLQQIADLAVGFGLRGMTLSDQAAYFMSPPGYVYAAILLVFALTPLWAWAHRLKGEA